MDQLHTVQLNNIKDLLNSESIEDVILGCIILGDDESIFEWGSSSYGSHWHDIHRGTNRFGVIIHKMNLFLITPGTIYKIGKELHCSYKHVYKYYDDGTISFE